jgi:hypothetical protein
MEGWYIVMEVTFYYNMVEPLGVASADTENALGSFPLSEERMSRKWQSLPSPFLSQTGSSEKGGA